MENAIGAGKNDEIKSELCTSRSINVGGLLFHRLVIPAKSEKRKAPLSVPQLHRAQFRGEDRFLKFVSAVVSILAIFPRFVEGCYSSIHSYASRQVIFPGSVGRASRPPT